VLDKLGDSAYSGVILNQDHTVAYSFLLYTFYVCLPLIPAVVIFRLFPDSKVSVSGPLQNFTVNATGAFAAYVVTVALGILLVQWIETTINSGRLYAVEGVFLDLGKNQYVSSSDFYSQYAPLGVNPSMMPPSRNYPFVMLFKHPVVSSEEVELQYWEIDAVAGLGPPPRSKLVRFKLKGGPSAEKFRLQITGDVVTAVEAKDEPASKPKLEVATEGDQYALHENYR
jgi:hypothetical protein